MDSLLSVSRVVVESKLSTIINQEIRESRMKSRDQVETCHKYSKSSLPCSRPCCNFYSDEFETMRIFGRVHCTPYRHTFRCELNTLAVGNSLYILGSYRGETVRGRLNISDSESYIETLIPRYYLYLRTSFRSTNRSYRAR